MLGAHSKAEAFAVLVAWKAVRQSGWPQLAPSVALRASQWPTMNDAALRAELQSLIDEMSAPDCSVRLFWKFVPTLMYRGYNAGFLADSGYKGSGNLLDKTDIHPEVGWARQGAKYRADDLEVIAGPAGVRDIIERQDQANATMWLHTVKSAVRTATGEAIGVLGMYEVIDGTTAARLQRRPR